MLIALDYDKTYTLHPEFWDVFLDSAKKNGHSVICASMRYESEGKDVLDALSKKVDRIIFTSRKAKSAFLNEINIKPDVWIDDSPFWIYQDSF